MNLTRTSIDNPAAIAVLVALVLTFGVVSITKLPVQLLPDIERPQITISTGWRAAAPEEMEAVIIEPQENVLKNISGISQITTEIQPGRGFINLTFEIGTDMQEALLAVINNLNQTPPLPLDADEPQVTAGGGGGGGGRDTAASLLVKAMPDSGIEDIAPYQDIIEDIVEPRLSRISGVARVNLNSRRPQELRIDFDPYRTAALGLQLGDISSAIARATDASGGFADVGRRQYTVRFAGQYDVGSLEQMIIGWSDERPIHLQDVATVAVTFADSTAFNLRNGDPAYYITISRANKANTVELLDAINLALRELNEEVLNPLGLEIDLSFDASVHIRNAVAMVQSNLGLGVILALSILWFFLRGLRPTLIIASTIPLSIMVAFIALSAFGRSLNVISLAGLAFAVGMVLDAAIIVQENIVRLRLEGMANRKAIFKGTLQVTGALFTSTVTSVAIFLPILFMEGVEAQLFSDLAIALSIAVIASMVVAITVLPVASQFWLRDEKREDAFGAYWDRLTGFVMRLTDTPARRLLWAGGLLGGAVLITALLMPKADFLPRVPTDGFFFSLDLPPGGNLAFVKQEIAERVKERIEPFMHGDSEPPIKSYNFFSSRGNTGGFIYSADPQRTAELMAVAREEIFAGIPDSILYMFRGSMLGFSGGGGRVISVDLQGPDIEALINAANTGMDAFARAMPEAMVQPHPGLSLAEPELRLVPDDRRITQAGLDRRTVANAVRAMTDGLFVSEYFDGNERINVILRGSDWQTPEELADLPLHTPLAGVQHLGELTSIQRVVGPSQLRRVNGKRTITLEVTPPATMPMQVAMDIIKNQVGPVVQAALPGDSGMQMSGRADQLAGAITDMALNFVMALLILFLIMTALFKSPKDSLLVLLVMPLALAGGMISLALLNLVTFQSLDLLTMIGFIILLGLVVNNAILLVDQTRSAERAGLDRCAAVAQAVRIRARPVYMSTLTSLFGMLPLMLVPGIGSEIYRGLATVIVGGMAVSATFTLVLLPSLLRMGEPRHREPVTDNVIDLAFEKSAAGHQD
ncbi:efflux RND transporter permease subunit [Exilibacterium tricleocarpae]|uniref:Efflux RND transporter permease subunit n=1 Tax=Exilibacterium tricleocarpae TaxID=2591008 RepID=A0A545U5D2_9GAMM|nr:efflux RND transporter permease subunit [Exilibacterium tricleocarpae]TQV84680.1 efflux RND transporter permease subunit [Exilibacterium tricleocarpae]